MESLPLSDCCLRFSSFLAREKHGDPPGWRPRLLEAVTNSPTPRSPTLLHLLATGRSIQVRHHKGLQGFALLSPSSSLNSAQPIPPVVDSFRSECALGLILMLLKDCILTDFCGSNTLLHLRGLGQTAASNQDVSEVSALSAGETRVFLLTSYVSKVPALFVDETKVFLLTGDVSMVFALSVDVVGVLLSVGVVSKVSALSADTTRALLLTGGMSKDSPHLQLRVQGSLHLQ